MTVVVSHPTGNPNVRAVLRAASRRGVLDSYWTGLAMPLALRRLIPPASRLRHELSRRGFDEIPWSQIRTRPQREAIRVLAGRMGLHALLRHETGWASVDGVYRDLDQAVARHFDRPGAASVRAVYAYEDGALETFRAGRKRGIRCLYDLPIAYWRTLHAVLAEERELKPQWATTIEGLCDSREKLARKDAEIENADKIIVASTFTRTSLTSHFGESLDVVVAPYGAPPPQVTHPLSRRQDEPLRIVYAGHLNQRKGIAYLIDALRRLDIPWRLTLAGRRPDRSPPDLDKFLRDPRCNWLGHVPHQTLLGHMARSHLFVFPSLIEGFGLVLFEAMAAGLPVITTPHTAGPDIIQDGCEGYIVPIRDPDAISARIAELYSDEHRRLAMGASALATATASNWSHYEDAISRVLVREIACG